IPGMLNTCGHECFEQEDLDALPASCGIAAGTTPTIRIGWVNHNREIAAFLESLNHSIEDMSNFHGNQENPNPYWSQYTNKFFDESLDQRYGQHFSSWYAACPYGRMDCITLDTPPVGQTASTSMHYRLNSWEGPIITGQIQNYLPHCGNAHIPPNGRGQ